MNKTIDQKANRLKLADMIEFRLEDAQFDMSTLAAAEVNDCGTTVCALGWAAVSGEIEGLGWNRQPDGDLCAVTDGKIIGWGDAADNFFGREARTQVFYGMFKCGRSEVATALRAIK